MRFLKKSVIKRIFVITNMYQQDGEKYGVKNFIMSVLHQKQWIGYAVHIILAAEKLIKMCVKKT